MGEPIHRITVGNGKIKIFAWSQMHGNESTTTKAVFDILKSFRIFANEEYIESLLKELQICFVPCSIQMAPELIQE
ncbi:hypothetical protein [Antarcticibacterium flavum]|uniref:hypothetical protein n=1 Tax=Antarcticibacterium flavum TaxID=2058175 RepID=UPI001FE602F9|nr:hypothetical protein [Antarcticibacterium flavum]